MRVWSCPPTEISDSGVTAGCSAGRHDFFLFTFGTDGSNSIDGCRLSRCDGRLTIMTGGYPFHHNPQQDVHMGKGRDQGSTITAYAFGVLFILMAIYFGIGSEFSWLRYGRCIDVIACLLFAAVLLAWAWSADWATDHNPHTYFSIGNPTVTMVVTVVTAVVAIVALVDTAASSQKAECIRAKTAHESPTEICRDAKIYYSVA
jgi:hypothetical protein